MNIIFNPLTNRFIKEYSNTGCLLKTFRDWENIEVVEKMAKRMHYHYKFKYTCDWKTDFLKIIEYYSISKIKVANQIVNDILERNTERLCHFRNRNSVKTYQSIYLETINEDTLFMKKHLSTDIICDCVICLDFENTKKIIIELPCKHKFHKMCIEQWLQYVFNCPMCKTNILM